MQSFELLRSFIQAMYSHTEEILPPAAVAGGGGSFDVSGGTAITPRVAAGSSARRRTLRVRAGAALSITVAHSPPDRVVLSWVSSPLADMLADSLVAVVSQVGAPMGRCRVAGGWRAHRHARPSLLCQQRP